MKYFIVKEILKIAKQILSDKKIIDKTTEFFKSLKKYKVINGIQTYQDSNRGFYYQFDTVHGHWQVYNKKGNHIFVFDKNGNFIDDAVYGRKINLK